MKLTEPNRLLPFSEYGKEQSKLTYSILGDLYPLNLLCNKDFGR